MIRDWRFRFNQTNLPFVYVELAGVTQNNYAEVRYAQFLATRNESNVSRASAIDLGIFNDVHPRNKAELARRATIAMRAAAYNVGNIHSTEIVKARNNTIGRIDVEFNSNVTSAGTNTCITCCATSPFLFSFDNGSTWVRSRNFTILADQRNVQVYYDDQKKPPTHLRYNHEAFPQCVFKDTEGKPVYNENKRQLD